MSYTATVEGDITGPLTNTFVSKLQGNTVTAAAPVAGQALTFNGVAWVPQTGTTPTDALAASLVFRAGGVAGGNVFTTWPSLYAAFLTTDGPVTIAVDTAPGGVVTATNVPAGAYNMQGRARIIGFSARETAGGPPYINVLTVQDGGIFSDLGEISGTLKVTVAPTVVGNIPFTFTAADSKLSITNGAVLANTGAFPVVSAPAAGFTVALLDQSAIDTSAATTVNGIFIALTPTSTVKVFAYAAPTISVSAIGGFASGAVGALLNFTFDASGVGQATANGAPPSPSLTTPATVTLSDLSQFESYTTALVAPAPPALVATQVQAAIDQLNTKGNEQNTQTINNAANPYVVDSGPITDNTILQNIAVGGGAITFPAIVAGNFREITIKDITGTQVGSTYTVNTTGGNLIDNSFIGNPPAAAFANPGSPWAALKFKSNGVAGAGGRWWLC